MDESVKEVPDVKNAKFCAGGTGEETDGGKVGSEEDGDGCEEGEDGYGGEEGGRVGGEGGLGSHDVEGCWEWKRERRIRLEDGYRARGEVEE